MVSKWIIRQPNIYHTYNFDYFFKRYKHILVPKNPEKNDNIFDFMYDTFEYNKVRGYYRKYHIIWSIIDKFDGSNKTVRKGMFRKKNVIGYFILKKKYDIFKEFSKTEN